MVAPCVPGTSTHTIVLRGAGWSGRCVCSPTTEQLRFRLVILQPQYVLGLLFSFTDLEWRQRTTGLIRNALMRHIE